MITSFRSNTPPLPYYIAVPPDRKIQQAPAMLDHFPEYPTKQHIKTRPRNRIKTNSIFPETWCAMKKETRFSHPLDYHIPDFVATRNKHAHCCP
jgi:hypothetical protein